jgi:hypothetical protein
MAANDTLSFIKALVDEQTRRQVAIDGIYSPALDISWGMGCFCLAKRVITVRGVGMRIVQRYPEPVKRMRLSVPYG